MDGGAWWAAVHGVANSRTWLSDLNFTFHFHALEKEMATHSSVLSWRIPGTGEPGGQPSMGLHRVRDDWSNLAAAAIATFLVITEGKQKNLRVFFTDFLLSDCLLMILILLSHFQNMSQIWSFPMRLTPPQVFFLDHWNSLLPTSFHFYSDLKKTVFLKKLI